jgi:predicted DNA-binding transcriptional regulator AlpA
VQQQQGLTMNEFTMNNIEEPARIVVDRLLTVRDLEHLLQINKRSVPRLCQRGLLPMPLKLGGGNRWRACDIVAAIDRLDPKIGQKNECVEMNQ